MVVVQVPLDDVFDEWMLTDGPRFVRKIAEHYGVFEHLFGEAFFHPVTPMSISFKTGENFSPVYFGNIIKPKNVRYHLLEVIPYYPKVLPLIR